MTHLNTHPLTVDEQKHAVKIYGSEVPDWAESTTAIRVALRDLDDALPTSNLVKAHAAYTALAQAQINLRRFFILRDVDLAHKRDLTESVFTSEGEMIAAFAKKARSEAAAEDAEDAATVLARSGEVAVPVRIADL